MLKDKTGALQEPILTKMNAFCRDRDTCIFLAQTGPESSFPCLSAAWSSHVNYYVITELSYFIEESFKYTQTLI